MSPKSALPKNYKIGPDNQSWLMKVKKKVQIALAAGPRVPSGFFKWRDIPRTLLAIGGSGPWRHENTDGSQVIAVEFTSPVDMHPSDFYASRIQPWKRWGFYAQWPLFLNFWFIYRQKNVVAFPTYQSAFGIKKMFTFGFGFKRDGDKVYWLTANVGGNFE